MAARRRIVVARIVPLAVVAAALYALGHRRLPLVLAIAAAVLLVLGVAAPRLLERFDRAVSLGAAAVGRALGAALGAIGWILLVLPVWAGSRLVRLDVLHRTSRSGDRWTARSGEAYDVRTAAAEPGSSVRWSRRQPRLRRAARAAFLVLVLIGLPLLGWQRLTTEAAPPAADPFGYTPIGHDDEPWARDLFTEHSQLVAEWDPLLGATLIEQDGRYVNVADGHRVSYAPADPTLTVWFFGGSTMYGIGQRDQHTIPSEVARLAEADGIRIEAVNFGFPGYVNWLETQQFAQALSTRAAPDLAIFYDGVNEMGLAAERLDRGDTDPLDTSRLLVSDYERSMWRKARPDAKPDPGNNELAARLAGEQYGRGVDLARRLGASYDVPVEVFWQPSLVTKRLGASDEAVLDLMGTDRQTATELGGWVDQAIEVSGARPIDLTGSLDAIDTPVYLDWGHTNELGARTVAAAMYEQLRPQLEALHAAES